MFGLAGTEMLFESRNAGVSVTLTCVPPGSGERMGVDRDLDGAYDCIDNCPGVANAGPAWLVGEIDRARSKGARRRRPTAVGAARAWRCCCRLRC